MLKLIVLSYAILLLFVSSRSSSTPASKRGDVRLCGRRLAEALNLLCQGQYYDPGEESNVSKRDLESGLKTNYPGWFLGLPSSPVSGSHYQQQLQSDNRARRQEGGVVDECCRQACPISVLVSYCGNGK